MKVTLYNQSGGEGHTGKYLATSVAAHEPSVTRECGRAAHDIASAATTILHEHHDITFRFHNLQTPSVHAEKVNSTDYYVVLEAPASAGTKDPDGRAQGIEFGHRYESRAENASGPWGQSEGLHLLDEAAFYVSVFRGN